MVKIGNVFKGMGPVTKNIDNASGVLAKVRMVDSGIPSLDNVMKSVPLEIVNGKVLANSVDFPPIGKKLISGRIGDAMTSMKAGGQVSAASEQAARKILNTQTPAVKLADKSDYINLQKVKNPDLNVSDFNSLPAAKKTKISTIIKNLAKGTLVVGGVLGVIYIGNEMYKSIQNAIDNLNGCWLVTQNPDGTTTSCKLWGRACIGDNDYKPCAALRVKPVHVPGYILKYEPDIFIPISTKLKGPSEENEARKFLAKSENYEPFIDELNTLTTTVAIQCPEDGGCNACSIGVDSMSPQYISPEAFDENQSVECVTNATLLDVIGDIATNLGKDVLGKFGLNNFKWILYAIFGIVGIFISVVIWKFFSNILVKQKMKNDSSTQILQRQLDAQAANIPTVSRT